MTTQRRIETNEAKQLRSQRQHFAAPGGSHDRLVRVLGKALPIGVGILAAFMVITPLSPRGEISFLLDRNKVAMIDERLAVDNAMYRGQDNRGRPFALMAGEAVQRSSAEGVVRMKDLVARLTLTDGPASLTADAGAYDIDAERVNVIGPVRLVTADGYSMTARGVTVDLEARIMEGNNGVEGAVPAGSFSARQIRTDIDARTVTLTGNARLTMVPGELQMP